MNPTAAPSDNDQSDLPIPLAVRIGQILAIPGRLLGALLIPDRVMPEIVRKGRYGAALLVVVAAGLTGAIVIGQRIDMTAQVLEKYPDAPGQKQDLKKPKHPQAQQGSGRADEEQHEDPKSDREIDDEIKKEATVTQVTMALGAGIAQPAILGLLAVGLFLLARFVGGKPTLAGTMATSAHAALPGAVKAAIITVAASMHQTLSPGEIVTISRPLSLHLPAPGMFTYLTYFDPFALWSLVIMGMGLAAAAQMSRTRAFIALGVCFLLFQLLTGGAGGPSS